MEGERERERGLPRMGQSREGVSCLLDGTETSFI